VLCHMRREVDEDGLGGVMHRGALIACDCAPCPARAQVHLPNFNLIPSACVLNWTIKSDNGYKTYEAL